MNEIFNFIQDTFFDYLWSFTLILYYNNTNTAHELCNLGTSINLEIFIF